jgi:iron complex outermembrane receptor protein
LRSNDEVGAKGHDGRTLQAGLDLKWNVPGRHELLLALGFTRSDLSSGSLVLPPLFDLTVHDISRHWTSVAIQDQWGISRSLTLTAGIRLDDFSDVGSRITPRFALVYQLDDHQILKSQYAEGFRTPAFFELYSTGSALPGLEPESIATTELSYILRQSRFVGRLTLFYSRLTNMIQPPSFPGGNFGNSASARTKGVEAEWSQELSRAAKISMNVSWADPDDERGTGDVLAASEWMWNLTLLTEPLPGWQLAGRWNHTGTRGGFAGTRTTDGYDTVDLTVSALKLVSGLTLRGGVKNLLDDPVIYITTLPPPIDPITQLYGGRSYWAQVSFRF